MAFIIYILLILAIGIISLLFGKKFVSVIVAVGFFALATHLCSFMPETANYSIFIAIGAAIIGFFLAKATEKVAFFLLGLAAGYFLGNCFIAFINNGSIAIHMQTLIEICFGVVFGVLCSIKSDLFIELGTAIFGARLIADAIVYLIFDLNKSASMSGNIIENLSNTGLTISSTALNHSFIVLVLTIILTIAGFIYQKKH